MAVTDAPSERTASTASREATGNAGASPGGRLLPDVSLEPPYVGWWLVPEVARSEGASVHATISVYRSNPTHEWGALQRPESGPPPAES